MSTIRQIRAFKADMQLKKPYTIAFETTTAVENAFLEIQLSDGTTGIGAASPSEFVIAERMDATMHNLQSDHLQQWIGKDILEFRSLIGQSKTLFPEYPATRAAIDIALHDAFGKHLGIPIVEFYGRQHAALPTSVTIGIMSVEETLAEAATYKQMGFKILKVKTGRNPDEDIERLVKLRERFGSYFTIRTDANQGYDTQQTITFFNATQHLGLELIEQPLACGRESEMRLLPIAIREKMACDESLKNARSALDLAAAPATCGIFNVKLMKCGGLLGALEISTIAEAAGIDLFWGCFDESIASISAALHIALACRNTRYLDLDGSLDLAEDLVEGGFLLKEGVMHIDNGPGFGCRLLD